MPPHPRIGRDQTVANFGASHKQHVTPGRSFGHFFHLRTPACPLPTTASRRRSPWAQAPYGQPRHGVLPFQVSRRICGPPSPARRWRQTCATRQTETLSGGDNTDSCHDLAGYLRSTADDGVCLLRTRCVRLATDS